MTTQPRLKIALIGLGRLGVIRARILAFQQPRVELVAVCDTKPGNYKWAAENLPASVKYYADPEDCMKNAGVEAILISTATATHAPLICLGLDLGLHVMCEKPISVDLIATEEVVAKAKSKPHLKFLVPFSRRYDDSYRAAKDMINSGSFGEIHAVDTACLDKQDDTGFFVAFSEQSGGIFLDMGIDIGRYYLNVTSGLTNPKKQVNRVIAMGQQAIYGDLATYGDCDNGWAMVEFANNRILTFHLGRTLTNGFESYTRICGTKAHSIVNGNSTINRVEVRDSHGVRTATTPDAFALFDKSFLNDIAEFVAAVLDDKPLSCTPDDAYEAAKIGTALQYSFRNGVSIYFDENGMPIMGTPDA
ncbi:NAD(P)-binding protein [Annulohypoxylon maeteangense]|uniref:NAD(P)-binding protein n=1 Tax=Annulohypoxylon maeteangense TaxID=1927788 RepID=UPI00200726B0|nr:NAD(P)-binding protein [Annulohypoxylon maeteangense]KAI0886894.1 NAD(P)-binding protein [Annulohypoxylon maeteangense]